MRGIMGERRDGEERQRGETETETERGVMSNTFIACV